MCGIFGAQWKKQHPTQPERLARAIILTSLARSMDDRGDQSHGIYLPEQDILHRKVGSIMKTSLIPYVNARSIMGHTRFATTGAVKAGNTHPFIIGNIVGMHNGTLSNHTQLQRAYGRDFRVDSMHLFAHIDEGHDLEDIQGYGTVAYIHRDKPGEILLGTFNNGDLTVVYTALGAIWASTTKAIDAALDAAMVERISTVRTEDTNLYVMKDATLKLRKEKFLTCGGSNWRAWNAYSDDRFEDYRSAAHVYGGRKQTFNYSTKEWEDKPSDNYTGPVWDEKNLCWVERKWVNGELVYGKSADTKPPAPITDRSMLPLTPTERLAMDAARKADAAENRRKRLLVDGRHSDRLKLWQVARDYGYEANDARRVFDKAFEALDEDDEFYQDGTGKFDGKLFMRALAIVDPELWALKDASTEECEVIDFASVGGDDNQDME
jgi:hypothetical protein